MKRSRLRIGSIGAVIVAAALGGDASAVSIGMRNDFENGTTQGWQAGMAFPGAPANVANGGPAGAGDNFLRISATGTIFAGSRLVAFNRTQWAGDWLAAGVNGLRLDVRNLGSTPLQFRIALRGNGGDFASTTGVPLAVGGAWQQVYLPLDVASLSPIGGFNLDETLAALSELRIMHSTSPSFQGGVVAGQLGVDNLTAIAFSAGDANRDATVDIFDVAVVSNHWGAAGPLGDVNRDNVVDIFDVALISNHWGEGVNDGSQLNVAAVPEPATWQLAFACAAALYGAAIRYRAAARGQCMRRV